MQLRSCILNVCISIFILYFFEKSMRSSPSTMPWASCCIPIRLRGFTAAPGVMYCILTLCIDPDPSFCRQEPLSVSQKLNNQVQRFINCLSKSLCQAWCNWCTVAIRQHKHRTRCISISQFDLLFTITFFVAVCKLNHLQAVVSYSLAWEMTVVANDVLCKQRNKAG